MSLGTFLYSASHALAHNAATAAPRRSWSLLSAILLTRASLSPFPMATKRPRSSRAERTRSNSVVSAAHQVKADRQRQLAHITRALHATPADTPHLRAISTHSFLTTAFRQQIWPLLLGLPANPLTSPVASSTSTGVVVLPASSYPAVRQHAYYSQVEKDIARSLAHFDVCRQWKAHHRSVRRAQLARIIHTIFSLHSDLHYIQGYHDIVAVLLLTLDDEYVTYQAAEHLSLMHIRDSLHPTLDTVVSSLSLIFPLLRLQDESLWRLVTDSGVQSFFTLSWVLTWFAHNVDRLAVVQHYFDFFLSQHPAMPIYVVVALILTQRQALLALRTEAGGEPIDASAVHALFQALTIDDEAACSAMCGSARTMWEKHPPRVLCELTPTPPSEASKVRVNGIERLMEDMQQEERSRKKREESGGNVDKAGGAGDRRRGGEQWMEWRQWMSDELKGKRLREWSLMGVTAVSAAVALAAYRLYGVNGT